MPWSNPVCSLDLARTLMTAEAWWRSAVIYQVWPRSFADSDGDGVGDLRGVIGKLDYLADLGVDAVWLSPFYPSPQIDNGYDVSDYQDVDPVFGSLADLDELIAGLHARGMRLIIDVVVNHTSDQHPWFLESRGSRDSPKRSWYYWREQPVNRWTSLFGGPVWQHDEATGEHYLHTFAPEQPDLNWDEPEVRRAVIQMLLWWLNRGVDGFRLDVISMVSKDLEDPDALLGFGPHLHEYMQELHRGVFAGHDLVTVGETPGASIEEALLFSDPTRGELDMVFGFEQMSLDRGESKWEPRPLSLPTLKRSFERWQRGLADGWNALYWDNHDQPRVVSRFGDDGEHRVASATTLATVLHLHRGTPFVYQGEELGMANPGFSSLADYRDLESLNYYAEAVDAGHPPDHVLAALQRTSRDNARTPMHWDDTATSGFTTGVPWIALAPDAATVNVAAQLRDPQSVLAHYRRLIQLRHDEPAVVHGDFTLLLADDERVWAFTRRWEDIELLVVANLSSDEVVPGLDGWTDGQLLLGNLPDPGTRLRPWESRVMQRRQTPTSEL
ncbi:MAG: oligo,6-glucosidase [Actinomycetota bacterium]|jgi:oligo-1,6-glucosidase|nr:oligo,6-glucosidase [Actinomycetota bacterium]